MSPEEAEIERKFATFAKLVHRGWDKVYAVTDAELAAVRTAVQEQCRAEEALHKRGPKKDQTTNPEGPAPQKQTAPSQSQDSPPEADGTRKKHRRRR